MLSECERQGMKEREDRDSTFLILRKIKYVAEQLGNVGSKEEGKGREVGEDRSKQWERGGLGGMLTIL